MKCASRGWCSNVKLIVRLAPDTPFNILENDLYDDMYKNTITRAGSFTFTRYKKDRNTLHVTGIRNFQKIPELCAFLAGRTDQTLDQIRTSISVNCSTWHLDLKMSVDLPTLYSNLPQNVSKRFCPERFAGLTFKFEQCTIIVFYSGKLNFFGVRDTMHFHRARIYATAHIYM